MARWILALSLLTATFWAGACTIESEDSEPKSVADAIGTVSGRIIDATTREGIAGAEVVLKSDGEYRSVMTADDEALGDFLPRRGDFAFADVPVGNHLLTIVAEGYAVRTLEVMVGTSNDNSPVSVNLKNVEVERGFSLEVYVTDNGSPVEGATVTAKSPYIDYSELHHAQTGSDGRAVLEGLPQNQSISLMVPAFDQDGDGTYDYQNSGLIEYTQSTDSSGTIQIELTETRRDDEIEVIDHNLDAPNRDLAVQRNQKLTLVFNYPILADTPGEEKFTLTYENTHIPVDLIGFGERREIPVTVSYSMSNTVLTIQPQSELIINQEYVLNGVVEARVNGELQQAEISLGGIYVYDDTSTGLGSQDFTITLDNFNTETNEADSFAGEVMMTFNEWVEGWAVVVSKTVWDGEINRTTYLNEPIAISSSGIHSNGLDGIGTSGANFNGWRHIAPLGAASADHTSTYNASYVIEFDIYDAEGNRYFGTLSRNVQ